MLSEMKAYRNWVAYRLEPKKDSPNEFKKIPYNPITGYGAKANEPSTWGNYEEAKQAAKRNGGGVGFEFSESPFAGIDIDNCIDSNGNLSAMAADILGIMNSYTEYSPSGRGLHIIFKGEILPELVDMKKEGMNNRDLGLELYYGGRYFTVTENPYKTPKPIIEASKRAEMVFRKYLFEEGAQNSNKGVPSQASGQFSFQSDRDLLTAMFSAKNGGEIRRLWEGDFSNYPSQSEAELALCLHLAFYTGNNAAEIDRLFRQSGLMRDKWNENHGQGTYGERTIAKAVAGTNNFYAPKGQEHTPSPTVKEKEATQATGQAILQNSILTEYTVNYMNDFMQEIKMHIEGRFIPTGFENLDKFLDGGFYPGLYFIGANSSLGKTAFVMQIADSIAKSGRDVIIFALEMARSELIARSLSRMSFIKSMKDYGHSRYAKTTRGVLSGRYNEVEKKIIAQSFQEYRETIGTRLIIREGIGDIGVEKIRNDVLEYMNEKKIPPVIVIDYIQILEAYSDKKTDKQNVDKNVVELKRLSRDYDIPVIGISSFNRENYKAPVSMASFKESGAIEYSSDVLLGAQYYGWDNQKKEKDNDRLFRLDELKEENEKKANKGEPQVIQVKILKNRNGARGDVFFEYYPLFNFFRPYEVSKSEE